MEGLEDRIVLSPSTIPLAHPQAQVHATASKPKAAPALVVPIVVTGINISSVLRDPTSGALGLAGKLSGTILGQGFTTPISGTIVPNANPKLAPALNLNLQPIHLGLLGLNVDTGAIRLGFNARANAGSLGKQVANGLSGVLNQATGGTTGTAAQIGSVLNDPTLLSALNRTFAGASARLNSATPAAGTVAPILKLALSPDRIGAQGLNLKLDNQANGAVSVAITSTPGGGLLGNVLGGVTGGTTRAVLGQVGNVLTQITATKVPITTTNLPELINGSNPISGTPTTVTSTSTSSTSPKILTLSLNPIDLNLLGLEVKLFGQDTSSPVTITISAQPGSGELLGNLLSTVANLLNTQGVSNALNTVLNNVIGLVNQSALSVNGQTVAPTYTDTTPVLDAFVAPVHLNLLGAVVDTSPIHLQILAHSGSGLALGNIVTGLANLLNNPSGNLVKDVEAGLTGLLDQLNQMFPTIATAATPVGTATSAPGAYRILSLTVPPINLNLLGLILKTSTIQVNATSQQGNGNLLGNLLFDVLNSAHITQTDLDTINADLNGVLGKVVGVLNATALTLPTGALGSLTPVLQQLASPTLIPTTGGATTPAPVLNLSIASQDGGPPVDVNLLGVVVTTSNIQVQLLAQPGDGLLLGTLVYNVSHLLDGGLLGVLSILNGLGL